MALRTQPTARQDAGPATSALDRNCKLHDLDNLYVVDSSFFVSSTAGLHGARPEPVTAHA
jgi:choline dehydrogenase-like flavoprotein